MPSLPDILDDLALLILRAEQSLDGRTFDDLIGNDEAFDALSIHPWDHGAIPGCQASPRALRNPG